MSEERIKERCKREDIALKIIKGFLKKDCYTDTELEYSLNTLLDLYNKQKEEIEQLANGIRVLGTNPDITTEEIIKEFTEKPITEEYMKEFKNRYISKDKIREIVRWIIVIEDPRSNNYRPIKNTSAQDVYEAFYKIKELVKE